MVCFIFPKKQFITMSCSSYTVQSTYDPTYCKSGPSDRSATGSIKKGVAIKYNSYDRYLNRIRKKNCQINNPFIYEEVVPRSFTK